MNDNIYKNVPTAKTFDEAVKNNAAFFKTINISNGASIIIEKYQYLKYYNITVVKNEKFVESFDKLSPYDAYNMTNELIANYIK